MTVLGNDTDIALRTSLKSASDVAGLQAQQQQNVTSSSSVSSSSSSVSTTTMTTTLPPISIVDRLMDMTTGDVFSKT